VQKWIWEKNDQAQSQVLVDDFTFWRCKVLVSYCTPFAPRKDTALAEQASYNVHP
jgi:hypothetical protein